MDQTTNDQNALSSFFNRLFHPQFYFIRDRYQLMFLCDAITLLIIVFGYSSFGEGGSGNVINDIQSNRVPFVFVLMLIVMSFLMITDRAIYLRKAVYCKLGYQLFLVIFLHVWIFLLPEITYRYVVLIK